MAPKARYSGASPSPSAPAIAGGAWSASGATTPRSAAGESGVAGGAAADAGGSVPGPARFPPELRGAEEQVLAAIAALSERADAERVHQAELTAALFDRMDRLEAGSRGASAPPSDDGYSSSSSGSTASSGGGPHDKEYLAVAAGDNRHWKAAERAQDIDQRPRRHSLYGYEPHDLLASGKHKGGGTLGVVMGYTEPICLYLQTAFNGVRDCADLADEISRGSELALTLRAAVNTLAGTYGMCNTLRTLVVERAQVTAPGCTAGDKRRQQWVESQLNEDDLGRTDVAPRIRKLKAAYDYEAGKQDLRKAAGSGGASGSTGNSGSLGRERDTPKKSKSSRRRERDRERKRDEHDPPPREKGAKGGRPKPPAARPKHSKPASDAESASEKGKSRKGDAPARKPDRERGRSKPADRAGGGGGSSRRPGGRDGGGSRRSGRRARSDDSGSAAGASDSGDSWD